MPAAKHRREPDRRHGAGWPAAGLSCRAAALPTPSQACAAEPARTRRTQVRTVLAVGGLIPPRR